MVLVVDGMVSGSNGKQANQNKNGGGNCNKNNNGNRGFPSQYKGTWNCNCSGNSQGNQRRVSGFNDAFRRGGGFNNAYGKRGPGNGRGFGSNIISRICLQGNHLAAECENRFNIQFIPNHPAYGYYTSLNHATRATCIVTLEGGIIDQGQSLHSEKLILSLIQLKI